MNSANTTIFTFTITNFNNLHTEYHKVTATLDTTQGWHQWTSVWMATWEFDSRLNSTQWESMTWLPGQATESHTDQTHPVFPAYMNITVEADRMSFSFSFSAPKNAFFYFSAEKKMHIFSVYFIFRYKYGRKNNRKQWVLKLLFLAYNIRLFGFNYWYVVTFYAVWNCVINIFLHVLSFYVASHV